MGLCHCVKYIFAFAFAMLESDVFWCRRRGGEYGG